MADQGTATTHPYTCLSCSLAFVSASAQRDHYATDLHRYNSKRRVAGLGAVTAELFNEKILVSRGPESAVEEPVANRLSCKACNKNFTTAATLATHELSKKHREAVFRAASKVQPSDLSAPGESETAAPTVDVSDLAEDAAPARVSVNEEADVVMEQPIPSSSSVVDPATDTPFESSGDPKLDLLVAARLRAAPPVPPTNCLFCPHTSASAKENVAHMRQFHSFVIPEEEFLVDLEGLLNRLGEEVGTWNVCICCGKGYGGNINLDSTGQSPEEMKKRARTGIEAVRAHMKSKSHCKLPYDTEAQRLDLADFYDFRPSYPDYVSKKERKAAKKAAEAAEQGWEDADDIEVDETEEGVEVVYESGSSDDEEDSDDDELPESDITYGDSSYELVLPSGARIGHRAHKNLHKQNLLPYLGGSTPFKQAPHSSQREGYKPSPHSQALLSLVPAMRKDKTHARPIYEAGLIPAKGAGYGNNGEVIKARNKGEAKNAMKATRQFKELKAYSDQAFIRGLKANSQEHYRDHLLQ